MIRITAARIRYCGHDASFVADIYDFGDAVTLHAHPIDLNEIQRPAGDVDFHLVDYPSAGFWKPNLGVFTVPSSQLRKVRG